jgi:protein-tyrosine-phosphatase
MRFFDLLAPDELEQIHHKALEVLEKVGCIIENHQLPPLEEKLATELDCIVAAADKDLLGWGR